MWGFTTPLDPVVDKRGRNADGTLNGHEYGGYRVNWFNPTRNAVQEVVAPDFWVIVLEAEGQTNHFLLPGNYPGSGAQGLGEPILTDARSYLPSGDTVYKDGDKIGPGYCWFDIPLELRPQKTNSAFLTIFAVRSINSGDTKVLPRPLNRTEWVESVKTFFPGMKVTFGSGGLDMTYGHKMSVKYPWNVVVSNSARVEVKP